MKTINQLLNGYRYVAIASIFILCQWLCHHTMAQSARIDSLENRLQQELADSTKSMVYSELGREYVYIQPQKALDYSNLSLEFANKAADDLSKAHALRTIASVNLILSNYVVSSELLLEAIDIFERLDHMHGLGNCYISLGIVHQRQEEFEQANEYQFKALNIFKDLNLPERQAICYNNIAESYLGLNEFKTALTYNDSSESINTASNNYPVLMSNYKNYGLIYRSLNDTEKSIEFFERVLDTSKILGDQSNANAGCIALIQLGYLNSESKPSVSKNQFIAAYELSKASSFDQHMVDALFGLYQINKSSGNLIRSDSFLDLFVSTKDQMMKKIIDQRSTAMESIYKARQNEQQIRILNNQRELQDKIIIGQWIMLVLMLLTIVTVVFFIFQLIRNNKRRVKTNKLLRNQNDEIKDQRDQILQQTEELQKNKARLREAQVVARLGGWEYHVKSNRLEWFEETRDVFSKIYKRTPTAQEYVEVIHPEDRQLFLQKQKELILHQTPYEEVIRHKSIHGDYLHIQLSARPLIKNGRVERIVGVSIDVTELVNYQKKLERLVLKKDVILGVVAHDLRSPLNNIKGLFGAIDINDDKFSSDDRELFDLMQKSADRGLTLINELLDVSEVSDDQFNLKLKKVDIVKVLNQVVTRIVSANNESRINLQLPSHPIELMIDRNRIGRVVENLISNAMKFTGEGGKIQVELTPNSNGVHITVSDSGIGIPKKMHGILFDRFSKARRSGLKGEASTGLGMSIVRRIVKLHRGSIDFESEEGKGTTFHIHLPSDAGVTD